MFLRSKASNKNGEINYSVISLVCDAFVDSEAFKSLSVRKEKAPIHINEKPDVTVLVNQSF